MFTQHAVVSRLVSAISSKFNIDACHVWPIVAGILDCGERGNETLTREIPWGRLAAHNIMLSIHGTNFNFTPTSGFPCIRYRDIDIILY